MESLNTYGLDTTSDGVEALVAKLENLSFVGGHPTVLITMLIGKGREARNFTLKALLDSGASACLIHPKFKRFLPLKNNEEPVPWTVPGGRMTTTQRSKQQFSFIGMHPERVIKWTFHLAPHPTEYDVILGSNLMRSIGLDILYSQELIVWDGENLPLYFEGERERRRWDSVEPLADANADAMLRAIVSELMYSNTKLNPYQHRQLITTLQDFEQMFDPEGEEDILNPNMAHVTLDKVLKELDLLISDDGSLKQWDNPCFQAPMGRIDRCRCIYDWQQHDELSRLNAIFTHASQVDPIRLTRFATLVSLRNQRFRIGPVTQADAKAQAPPEVEMPYLFAYDPTHNHVLECGNHVLVTSHWDFPDHMRKVTIVLRRLWESGFRIKGFDCGYVHKKKVAHRITHPPNSGTYLTDPDNTSEESTGRENRT